MPSPWTNKRHAETTVDEQVGRELRNAKRRAKRRDDEETREQKRLVQWARERGLTLFHPPNQLAARSAKQGAQNKALGVTAGVADLIVLDPCEDPSIRGVAIEMKSWSGTQTPEQRAWQKVALRCGWAYFIARSAEEGKAILRGLGL